MTPIAGEPTEVGSDDEEAAIVEAYAFAERVRDELFGDGAVRPEAAAGPEPAQLQRQHPHLHHLPKIRDQRRNVSVPKPSPKNISGNTSLRTPSVRSVQ